MNFKSVAYNLSEFEFADAYTYRSISCMANDRNTDLNFQCVEYMQINRNDIAISMLDIRCGRIYWLDKVVDKINLELNGCDLNDQVKLSRANYVIANVENIPFDNSFDIVTCYHTIEHIRDLEKTINELKRVTRKQFILVIPCQRFFKFTLDLHLNFFPIETFLASTINVKNYKCEKIFGHWDYIAQKG